MQEMPRKQRHTLWGKLASLLQDVLQDLPPEQWDRGEPEGMEVQSAVDPVGLSNGGCMFYTIAHKSSRFYSQNRAVAVVDGVTLVAALSLKVLQDGDSYSALLQVALTLHGGCPSRRMRGVYALFEWSNVFFFCCFSDVFVSTFERDAPLQHCIHNLCEAWWKKDLKEKETFGRTAFFVSLKYILASKKPVSV